MSEIILFQAIKNQDPEHIKILFNSGDVNINICTNFDSYESVTPVSYALKIQSSPEILKLLLKQKVEVNVADPEGLTLLHHTSHLFEDPEIASLLIANGAEINKKSKKGLTPLHFAVSSDYFETVQTLIDFDANINAKDENGDTSLHMASSHGFTKILEFLVKCGAKVNAQNNVGLTPLHLAEEVNTASFLIDNKADVNATDAEGTTPLYIRARKDNPEILKLLVESGANINAKTRDGSSPLFEALFHGATENVKKLLSLGADTYFDATLQGQLLEKKKSEAAVRLAVSYFEERLVQLKILGLLKDNTFVVWVDRLENSVELQIYEKYCQKELKAMESQLVCDDCDLTFEHILTQSLESIAAYFCLKHVKNQVYEADMKVDFPFFSDMLMERIAKVRRIMKNME